MIRFSSSRNRPSLTVRRMSAVCWRASRSDASCRWRASSKMLTSAASTIAIRSPASMTNRSSVAERALPVCSSVTIAVSSLSMQRHRVFAAARWPR